jgi:hypothetical protein
MFVRCGRRTIMSKAFGHASVASQIAALCLRSAPPATAASGIAASGAEADSGATTSGQRASSIRQARPESGHIAEGSRPRSPIEFCPVIKKRHQPRPWQ